MQRHGPAAPGQLHALVGGHDLPHARGPEVIDSGGPEGDGVVVGPVLPRAVGGGVVQGEAAELVPRLLRVVGHVHERRAVREEEEAVGVADLLALLPVDLADLGVGRHGEERQAQAGGPLGRGPHRAAGPHQGLGRARRPRRDHDGAAPPVEGLAGPGLAQHAQVLLGDGAPPADVDVGHLELGRPVAEAGHQGEAAPTGEVEGGDLLGEADGVVQWKEQGVHHHVGTAGRPEDQPGERGRGRHEVDPVVLRDGDRGEAPLVGPPRHLEALAVLLGVGDRAERRAPHVEPDRGHCGHRRPPARAGGDPRTGTSRDRSRVDSRSG